MATNPVYSRLVALFVSAWIEINDFTFVSDKNAVALFVSAWIEIQN